MSKNMLTVLLMAVLGSSAIADTGDLVNVSRDESDPLLQIPYDSTPEELIELFGEENIYYDHSDVDGMPNMMFTGVPIYGYQADISVLFEPWGEPWRVNNMWFGWRSELMDTEPVIQLIEDTYDIEMPYGFESRVRLYTKMPDGTFRRFVVYQKTDGTVYMSQRFQPGPDAGRLLTEWMRSEQSQ